MKGLTPPPCFLDSYLSIGCYFLFMVIGVCSFRGCNNPSKKRYCRSHESSEVRDAERRERFLYRFKDWVSGLS